MREDSSALVLARSVAALTGLPLDHRSLIRALHSERYRTGMDARARRASVREAFQVIRPRLIEDERILLIDDVFTTGATVASCAEALRAAGAPAVYVLTVARAAEMVTGEAPETARVQASVRATDRELVGRRLLSRTLKYDVAHENPI